MRASPIPRPVKVLIIDDHPIFAEVLATVIAQIDGFEPAAVALNGAAALAKLESTPYNLVLLDLVLPGLSGIELLMAISQRHPDVRVVVCSGLSTTESIETCFRLGAYTFVPKSGDVADVIAAIRGAADGKTVFDSQVADVMRNLTLVSRRKKPLASADLEILRRLAGGVPTKVIARECNISMSAVYKAHQRILSRLDITSDHGLAAAAARFGLIEDKTFAFAGENPSPAESTTRPVIQPTATETSVPN